MDKVKVQEKNNRTNSLKVLIASSECVPLVKTGGLADVVGSLPIYLKNLGADARVILPYHHLIKEKYQSKVEHLFYFYVSLGWRRQYAGIEKLVLNGITYYLVDSNYYYGDNIYRGGNAEIEQYAFFQRVVLDCLPNIGFYPDIIHCNDWQTALIPFLAKTQYKGCMQENRRFLLTIHNIMYQGKCGFDFLQDLLGIENRFYTPDCLESDGCANFLKCGFVFADKINTVSPTYANEIQNSYYGEGLDGILRARSADLCGILNGIDYKIYNSGSDPDIPEHYTEKNMHGKSVCKSYLQTSLGLQQSEDIPIISMVTRLTEQKGLDLLIRMLDELVLYNNLQFVILGNGEEKYENYLRYAEERYKGRVCSYIGYNDKVAHLIYSGSDFLLMPSRFEPCGISQMIAMKYGTVPIVRETGGLKDTVVPYNKYDQTGNGFSFANFNAHEMKDAVLKALASFEDKKILNKLRKSCMTSDFSFEKTAKQYLDLYLCLLN
jgi:starch synthase